MWEGITILPHVVSVRLRVLGWVSNEEVERIDLEIEEGLSLGH